MKTWERWTFGLLAVVVTASGFVYLWMRYVLVADDPFAVVNHPWQGAMLAAHVLASPPLILMFGIVLHSHVLKKLGARKSPNRASGLISFATFFTMIATGYLLQIVTGEGLLLLMVVAHVASGVLFAAAYAAHLLISMRLARAIPGGRSEAA
jgi:hypothetical protein